MKLEVPMIRIEREGGIIRFVIDRPERKNALDDAMVLSLRSRTDCYVGHASPMRDCVAQTVRRNRALDSIAQQPQA